MQSFRECVDTWVKPVLRLVVEGLCVLVPPKRGAALVYCAVATEANAVETVRWLSQQTAGRITWLVGHGSQRDALRRLLDLGRDAEEVRIGSVRDPRWPVWLAQSELFFFTHPLLGGPTPMGARRIYVNLWHGDGPKPNAAARAGRRIAHFTVAGTRLWGEHKAAALSSGEALICGNPRIDQYQRPATDRELARIGVDPSRKIVVWAPTFRRGGKVFGGAINHTTAGGSAFEELLASRELLQEVCERSGICLVVKPHPLDAANFERFGLVAVSDETLLASGIGLYQLLARADALVSDYSSIWTDFLVLDRPIAIYCPDVESYLSGFFAREGALDPSPSPVIDSVDELLTFLGQVGHGEDPHAGRRARACRELGAVLELGATERAMSRIRGSR
jgi:hypothetical protein